MVHSLLSRSIFLWSVLSACLSCALPKEGSMSSHVTAMLLQHIDHLGIDLEAAIERAQALTAANSDTGSDESDDSLAPANRDAGSDDSDGSDGSADSDGSEGSEGDAAPGTDSGEESMCGVGAEKWSRK